MSTETPNPGQPVTPVIHDRIYVMHWLNSDGGVEFTNPRVIGPVAPLTVQAELRYALEASQSIHVDLSEEIERNMHRINCVVVWMDTTEINASNSF